MHKSLLFLLLIISFSCSAQKLVKRATDAPRLMEKKEMFVNKSLKKLLDQIEPEIGFVYGDPTLDGNTNTGPHIKFFFISKSEFKKNKENQESYSVTVIFKRGQGSDWKKIPTGGMDATKEYLIKSYGDMIVARVSVKGKSVEN